MSLIILHQSISFPFFDGAAVGNIGGVGFVIHLSGSHHLNFSLGCGSSTNTRSELLSLWALLAVTKQMGIPLLSIFGDSLVIISWANIHYSLNSPILSHWCDDIRILLQSFPSVTIQHVYREHNQLANGLSKKTLSLFTGYGNLLEFENDMIIDHGNFKLFKAVLCWISVLFFMHSFMISVVYVAQLTQKRPFGLLVMLRNYLFLWSQLNMLYCSTLTCFTGMMKKA